MSSLFRQVDGRCPYCNGLVNVIEGSVLEYTLDNDGYPNKLNTENYKIAAYCKNCCRKLFALPNDGNGYNIYPINIEFTLSELDCLDNSSRLSVITNKILSSTDESINPFTNVREYNIKQLSDNNDNSLIEEDVPF